MSKLISLKLDVSKIDKSKLFKGKKGTYLDLTIAVNDEKDQYDNDVSAWQSQTKEERQSNSNKNFLGNGKVFWSSNNSGQQNNQQQEQPSPEPENDDLPF